MGLEDFITGGQALLLQVLPVLGTLFVLIAAVLYGFGKVYPDKEQAMQEHAKRNSAARQSKIF
ncbi:MAG: hypothetical protein V1911_02635 [Candidatus Micrarchaeota archaeon]